MTMYDQGRAGDYWDQRARDSGGFRAVVGLATNDRVNAAFDRWERSLLERWLPDVTGQTIVDVGAGIGRHALPLLRRGAGLVILIDVSAHMLMEAAEAAEKLGEPCRYSLVVTGAESLPADDQSADVVLMLGLLEHLPPHVRVDALAEAARVLRPGGVLIVSVSNDCSRWLRVERHRDPLQRENGYLNALLPVESVVAVVSRWADPAAEPMSNVAHSVIRHLFPVHAPLIGLGTALDSRLRWPRSWTRRFADHRVMVWRKR